MLGMYHQRVMAIGIILAILAMLVSFGVSRRLTHPIEAMKKGAKRFASGDLGFKLTPPSQEELRSLAESLNAMAGQLDERIKTITRQRNEQDTVFASMVEGVVAVDTHDKIIAMNPAAGKILGVDHRTSQGLWIHEVIRNSDLEKFLTQTMHATATPVEGSIVLGAGAVEQHLSAHGTPLYDAGGKPIGALVVLNDITQLRRLENIRKDFVANVSHELRTPLTAIKGFVETILSGESALPEETRHFLGIIDAKVDRLCSIVDDLLSLSSLERDADRREVPFELAAVRMTLSSAIEDCAPKAREKQMVVSLVCDDDLTLFMNPSLIEQAVVNLLDNAIKYSDSGTDIEVSARSSGTDIAIAVTDHGSGIAPEHHDRLFERFYRVDRARSRKLGGTGLGLSIVKNIIAAHGGRVAMESMPGKGSTFTLFLPAKGRSPDADRA
jgi:two-component system phosphate regulon sensor histidine kinase PhoR